jgi:hypothetical protein
MTATDRISEMVASGKISAAEGEALRAAMARKTGWRVLFNPFVRMSDGVGLGLTLVALVANFLIAWQLRVRFNGALDLHPRQSAISPLLALLDCLDAVVVTALVLWCVGLVLNRSVRFIDFLNTVGVSRLPVLLGAIPIALLTPSEQQIKEMITNQSFDPKTLIIALIGLPVLVWQVTLLYTGFKTATGQKAPRVVGGFVLGLIAAEMITWFLMLLVPKGL